MISKSYSGRELKKLKSKFKIFFNENSKKVKNEQKLDFEQFQEFLYNYEIEKHCK